MDKQSILREHFGYQTFREGQEPLIDAILAGRDVFGVMPTGGGKSLCYQIPALLLEGLTLVVSPLISLMNDQVAALKEAGIPAAFLNSSLTAAQQREVLRRAELGAYKLIYVTPERLLTDSFLEFAAGHRDTVPTGQRNRKFRMVATPVRPPGAILLGTRKDG